MGRGIYANCLVTHRVGASPSRHILAIRPRHTRSMAGRVFPFASSRTPSYCISCWCISPSSTKTVPHPTPPQFEDGLQYDAPADQIFVPLEKPLFASTGRFRATTGRRRSHGTTRPPALPSVTRLNRTQLEPTRILPHPAPSHRTVPDPIRFHHIPSHLALVQTTARRSWQLFSLAFPLPPPEHLVRRRLPPRATAARSRAAACGVEAASDVRQMEGGCE